ncbi:MAG TPA: transporter [Acetobacteraceae bacterium]|nr:transporter [Acetobacteraceae bacterium]
MRTYRRVAAARRGAGRGGRLVAACLAGLMLAPCAAWADPWIPPEGTGTVKPMIRFFRGNRAFPTSGFTTNTQPSSTETHTQFRITGEHGLGHGFSVEYDFRDGFLGNSKFRQNKKMVANSSGLEDQKIGLNYGLRQTRSFADSATLNVVIPTGSASSTPRLGTGRWAIEPDYQVGFSFNGGRVFSTLVAGPRAFLDGAATQLRAELEVGVSPIRRLTLSGTVFYVRTLQQRSQLPAIDQGERYNLLRFGVQAEYRWTSMLRPFVGYDVRVAGKGIHAGQRFILGLAIHY